MPAPLLIALALAATPPSTAPPLAWDCHPARQAQAEADGALAKRALAAPAQLTAMLPQLEAALDRAPAAPLPRRVVCGDTVIVHGDNPLVDLLRETVIRPQLGSDGAPGVRRAIARDVPYVSVAFLVGSALDSQGRYEDAVAALRRGDALQPGGALIASELAFALAGTHRNDEAVSVLTAALNANPLLPGRDAARLHRTRGYALGELGRYDEAIADYEASQKLDSTEKLSANEITYLQGRKAGRGGSQVLVITSDKVGDPLPKPSPPPT